MKLIIQFDLDADIIDVPLSIIENKEVLRKRFLKWIYNPNIRHRFWCKTVDDTGNIHRGLRYRSDAFVEWLNNKELRGKDERAIVVEQYIDEYPSNIPVIFF